MLRAKVGWREFATKERETKGGGLGGGPDTCDMARYATSGVLRCVSHPGPGTTGPLWVVRRPATLCPARAGSRNSGRTAGRLDKMAAAATNLAA